MVLLYICSTHVPALSLSLSLSQSSESRARTLLSVTFVFVTTDSYNQPYLRDLIEG